MQHEHASEHVAELLKALENYQKIIQEKNEELENVRKIVYEKDQELRWIRKSQVDFLASVSYELRTPLNNILMLSELFSDNREGNLTINQLELASTIHAAGLSLSELIDKAVEFASLEAGTVEVHPAYITITELEKFIEKNFRASIEQKNLAFYVEIAEDAPVRMYSDLKHIQRIVESCLQNALKFTQEGEIRVSIYGSSDERIAIDISDTGIGIPRSKQRQVFEAFLQLDRSLTKRYEGAGMGLAIANRLTKLLGGDIRVISREKIGSTFTVSLPRTFVRAKKQSSQILPASSSLMMYETDDPELERRLLEITNIRDDRHDLAPEDFSILVIEDDPYTTKIIFDQVHARGGKCLVAGDGEAGLQLADQYRPSALMLSLDLFGLNGWKIMERLKDNFETRHLPIYLLSSDKIPRKTMKMGILGYIGKPLTAEVVGQALCGVQNILTQPRKLLVLTHDAQFMTAISAWIEDERIEIVPVTNDSNIHQALTGDALICLVMDVVRQPEHGFMFLESLSRTLKESFLPVIVYSETNFTSSEEALLDSLEQAFTLKKVYTLERLLDEITLFLHIATNKLPATQQKMLQLFHPAQVSFENKRILLVDSDMRNVFTLSSELQERGADVFVAENAAEALGHLFPSLKVDVLLLSTIMPDEEMFEFIKRIRKHRPERLPIIVMKSKAIRGDRRRYINAGASEFLSKPTNIERFLSLLRVWLY